MKWLVGFVLALYVCPSFAKIYKNNYISTDIPDTWICFQENTAHICRSPNDKSGSEAIMIINARMRSPQDNLGEFHSMLNKQRTIFDVKNKPIHSTVYTVRDVKLNGKTWVESTQFNSEIPNFYSFYYATVDDQWDVAVLVNFNVHVKGLAKYKPAIGKIVQTLRFLPAPPPSAQPQARGNPFSFASPNGSAGASGAAPRAKSTPWLLILLGVFILGIAAYFWRN